jgi:hypothetical protein
MVRSDVIGNILKCSSEKYTFFKWIIQMCMKPCRILSSSDVSEELKLVKYSKVEIICVPNIFE